MGYRLRLLLWIPVLTYEGVLLSGGRNLASPVEIATLGALGASSGFLLASIFTIRQCRREKTRLRR